MDQSKQNSKQGDLESEGSITGKMQVINNDDLQQKKEHTIIHETEEPGDTTAKRKMRRRHRTKKREGPSMPYLSFFDTQGSIEFLKLFSPKAKAPEVNAQKLIKKGKK